MLSGKINKKLMKKNCYQQNKWKINGKKMLISKVNKKLMK